MPKNVSALNVTRTFFPCYLQQTNHTKPASSEIIAKLTVKLLKTSITLLIT